MADLASSKTDTFEQHRMHAMRIAYRMLGAHTDAEDVVQDAWLRWHKSARDEIRSPRAWLTTVVTRLAIDRLRAATRRRESYPGPWLPTPQVEFEALPDTHTPSPEDNAALADDISFALLVVLERLAPEERAAFILREAFDTDYATIARILGKSEAACRQTVSRAGKRIKDARPRIQGTRAQGRALHTAFLGALQSGDVETFGKLCAEDALLLSDGGGKVPAALNPLHGKWRISRFFLGVYGKWKKSIRTGRVPDMPLTLYPARVNGLPGVMMFLEGTPFQSLAFETCKDGTIGTFYMVRNPDKLAHIRPPRDRAPAHVFDGSGL